MKSFASRLIQRFSQFLRYGAVGVFNAGTYLLLYSALILLGVPYVAAAILAFPLPVALGYWLHEHWTFSRGEPTAARLGAFVLVQAGSALFSLLLLIAFVDGLGVPAIPARIVTTVMTPLLVYVISRAYVFAAPAKAGAVRDAAP